MKLELLLIQSISVSNFFDHFTVIENYWSKNLIPHELLLEITNI